MRDGAMPWVFGHKLEYHAPSRLYVCDIGTLRVGIEKANTGYAWFVGHVAHGTATSRILAVDAIKDEIRKLASELQETISK